MKKIILLIGGVIVLGIAWYLGSPLIINKEVDEAFPVGVPTPEELAAMSPEELEAIRDEVMAKAAAAPDKVMAEAMALAPQLLKSGSFRDADSFHRGSGEAKIYVLPDGARILRFENFSVTNGPDLRVLLTEAASPESQNDIKVGEYIELAPLKGNKGDQNYELPPEFNIEEAMSVVIYCKPFHVIFSVAPLK